jgi:hypothetical protein
VKESNIYFEMVRFLVGWGGLWHGQWKRYLLNKDCLIYALMMYFLILHHI